MEGGVPEGMARGGVQDGGMTVVTTDRHIDEVAVMVNKLCGDGAGTLVLAVSGLGGLNAVTGFDLPHDL